jgi:hypothetical protein
LSFRSAAEESAVTQLTQTAITPPKTSTPKIPYIELVSETPNLAVSPKAAFAPGGCLVLGLRLDKLLPEFNVKLLEENPHE